jgi:hypothetical protein
MLDYLSPRSSAVYQASAYLVCKLWHDIDYEDIYFFSSSDQGLSWSSPERITWFKSQVAIPKMSYTPASGYYHVITARKGTAGRALIYKRGVQ